MPFRDAELILSLLKWRLMTTIFPHSRLLPAIRAIGELRIQFVGRILSFAIFINQPCCSCIDGL